MLLFVHNPLANKPPIPCSTSGAINEAEFLTFDLTPYEIKTFKVWFA